MITSELPITEKDGYLVVQREHLEAFIENNYKQKFDFLKDQETVSGISYIFDVKKDQRYEFQNRRLISFINNGFHKDLISIILDNLRKVEAIPEGKYFIIS